jgi:putative ABC transport system permease protein
MMSSDLAFALRRWRKKPIPAIAALVTLALGTGANTAIFSIIHSVMLKPLPYVEPQRLVQIWSVDLDPNSNLGAMATRDKQLASTRELDRWRELSASFRDIAYYRPWLTNFTAPGEPERVPTALISASFFATLGVTPARGRAFTAADLVPGKDRVAILSDTFWRRRFGGNAAVLGQSAIIDGYRNTIVGVLPPDFRLIAPSINEQPDVFQPISILMGVDLGPESAFAFGRLKPGVALPVARDEMSALVRRLPPDELPGSGKRGVNLVRLDEEVASGLRPALLILFGAAGCVLLIACGNIANLILADTAARQRELALRTALGAGRRRLASQLLTESIVLCTAGTAMGLPLAWWALRAMVHLYPGHIPRLESLSPEPAVFAFAACLALISAMLSGAVPAWRYSRPDVQQVLKGSAGPGGQRGGRFRGLLTAGQIAASLVLLIGAGLLLRSFLLLRAVDPGFQRHNLLTAHLMLDNKTYAEPAQQAAFVTRLMNRLDTLPAVEMAGATNSLPLSFNMLLSVTMSIEGHPELGENAEADCRSVTPYFLQTMGIGLWAGRYLQPADSAPGGGVLVNRAFARQYFGSENPVGRHLRLGPEARPIVGVVPDIRELNLDRNPIAAIYLPFDRQPGPFVDLAVRTAADPKFLVNAVRAALRDVDPNQPLGKVVTMNDVLREAVAKPRWYAILVGSFAGLALLLAAVGIYGVVAYAVGQRTNEIGIRMALGAGSADILRMVLLGGLRAPLCGVIAGLSIGALASKVLASFLYGIKPLDLGTYGAAALLVLLVAVAAAYFPARRATAVDPMVALRWE